MLFSLLQYCSFLNTYDILYTQQTFCSNFIFYILILYSLLGHPNKIAITYNLVLSPFLCILSRAFPMQLLSSHQKAYGKTHLSKVVQSLENRAY